MLCLDILVQQPGPWPPSTAPTWSIFSSDLRLAAAMSTASRGRALCVAAIAAVRNLQAVEGLLDQQDRAVDAVASARI